METYFYFRSHNDGMDEKVILKIRVIIFLYNYMKYFETLTWSSYGYYREVLNLLLDLDMVVEI